MMATSTRDGRARVGRGPLAARDVQQAARFHRELDRGLRRVMAVALLACAALVGAVLGVVATKVQQVRLAYQLDGLRQVQAEEEEVVRRLRVELQTMRSLARIEEVAHTRLGMVRPHPDQVLLAREFLAGASPAAAAQAARRTAATLILSAPADR